MSGDTPALPCEFELDSSERRYHSGRCDRLCQRTEGHVDLVHRCACGVTVPVEGSTCLHARTVKAMVGKTMVTQCAACELRTDVFPGDPEDDGLDGWDELYSSGEVPPETKAPCPTCSGPVRETVGLVCQTCGTDYGAAGEAEHKERVRQALEFITALLSPGAPDPIPDGDLVTLPAAHVRAILDEVHDQRATRAVVADWMKTMGSQFRDMGRALEGKS